MQKAIRIAAVIAAVALIVVIGWIIWLNGSRQAPAAEATAEPTAAAQTTPEPEQTQQSGAPAQEAQDDAQGTMYEGALAGLTEEEIAALALAEEHSAAQTESVGAEDAVD